MAVSQYLRPESLIDAVKSHLTPDVVRKASSLVGESESSTRSALNASTPSVLSGLVNMVSGHDGANTLSGLIKDGGYNAATENVASIFGGGNASNYMMSSGQRLLGKIFGNNSSAVADVVAKSSGVSSGSATKLLSLSAPLVMGVLGKMTQGMNPSGVANSLLHAKSEIAGAAPAGLSQILSGGRADVVDTAPNPVRVDRFRENVRETTTREPESVRVVEQPPERKAGLGWLPWLLIGLGLLGLLFWMMRGRTTVPEATVPTTQLPQPSIPQAPPVAQVPESITLPGGHNISVPKGSINYNLASFLSGETPGTLPKTFVFDNLNFESDSAQLTPESVPTVNNLAAILKAYPNARVELVGHTDNTGTPEANQELSLNRANAVKTMLVNQGVPADEITTRGHGQTQPIDTNDTPEGRAKNRRTELNVVGK